MLNIAEESHYLRLRRRQAEQRGHSWPGSFHDTLLSLKESGVTADKLQVLLDELLYLPVMTAHPSEVKRRNVKSALRCFGSWIGGDRDGNPNVTWETTILALRMQAQTIFQEYSRLDELRGQLSHSDGFCELSAAFLKSHQWCIDRSRM